MRLAVTICAALALLACQTVAVQVPRDWYKTDGTQTDQAFYRDKADCEARSQAVYGDPFLGTTSYTDGRRWSECMVGKGWYRRAP